MHSGSLSCPIPHSQSDRVLLAHGEGAALARRLVRSLLLEPLHNEFLRPLADAAVLPAPRGRLALSTDSYVVSPLFFPGGDIGQLAVHGTVNDLAMMGAVPLYLSLGLILEEGLPIETLERVIAGIQSATRACNVLVVAGDTKVVPRGAADQLFVNTSGIGCVADGVDLGPHRVRPGDRVLVSGTIADHGIAVLLARENLGFESDVRSDTAPLHDLVRSLLENSIEVHCLRDPTRGGVSAALREVCEATGCSVILDESSLPLRDEVRGACELLGLDPLYVANEGKLLAIVPESDVASALMALRAHPLGAHAAVIGEVTAQPAPDVLVRGPLGVLRVLDEPTGAPLPRIC